MPTVFIVLSCENHEGCSVINVHATYDSADEERRRLNEEEWAENGLDSITSFRVLPKIMCGGE